MTPNFSCILYDVSSGKGSMFPGIRFKILYIKFIRCRSFELQGIVITLLSAELLGCVFRDFTFRIIGDRWNEESILKSYDCWSVTGRVGQPVTENKRAFSLWEWFSLYLSFKRIKKELTIEIELFIDGILEKISGCFGRNAYHPLFLVGYCIFRGSGSPCGSGSLNPIRN